MPETKSFCDVCGDPIHFSNQVRSPQWVHDNPLGQLKVSMPELDAVMDELGRVKIGAQHGLVLTRNYGHVHNAKPARA